MSELKGVCAAICTPFSKGGLALDESALRDHLDSMIDANIHVIAVCGGTGEFPFLSTEEKRRIIEVSAKHINGRAKMIVQTSAIRTEDAIEASMHAEANGADVLLILPPFFEGPDADGVFWHYEQLAKAVHADIMAYNIPQYSGFDITPDFFARLQQLETVRYLKDSTGDMFRLEQLLEIGANVFNGCDYLNFYALMAGCIGCFSGTANAIPKESVALYELVQAGHFGEALVLWRRMQPLNLFFWRNPYNPSAKAASNLSGRPVGECRLPVLPLSEVQKADLQRAMNALVDDG